MMLTVESGVGFHYQNENINTDFVKVIENMNSGTAAIWVEEDGDNRIVITPEQMKH